MLNIGDILFKKTRFSNISKVKVAKITPKGYYRLSDGSLLDASLRKKTSDSWNTTSYFVWSESLQEEFDLVKLNKQLTIRLEELKVKNLTKKEIEKLLDVTNIFLKSV